MINSKDDLRKQLEPDIAKALALVKEFRIKVLRQNINPIAARVAIKFMEKVDEHFAKTKISPQMEIAIEEIALDLYEQTLKAVKH